MKVKDFEVGSKIDGWYIIEVSDKYIMASKNLDIQPFKFEKVFFGGKYKAIHGDIVILSDKIEPKDEEIPLEDITIGADVTYVDTYRKGFLSYDRFLKLSDDYIKKIDNTSDPMHKLKLEEEFLNLKYNYYTNARNESIPYSDSYKYAESNLNNVTNELFNIRDSILDLEEK
jgi:hypothetical protein